MKSSSGDQAFAADVLSDYNEIESLHVMNHQFHLLDVQHRFRGLTLPLKAPRKQFLLRSIVTCALKNCIDTHEDVKKIICTNQNMSSFPTAVVNTFSFATSLLRRHLYTIQKLHYRMTRNTHHYSRSTLLSHQSLFLA